MSFVKFRWGDRTEAPGEPSGAALELQADSSLQRLNAPRVLLSKGRGSILNRLLSIQEPYLKVSTASQYSKGNRQKVFCGFLNFATFLIRSKTFSSILPTSPARKSGDKVRSSSTDFDHSSYFVGFQRSFSRFSGCYSSIEFDAVRSSSISFIHPGRTGQRELPDSSFSSVLMSVGHCEIWCQSSIEFDRLRPFLVFRRA